MLILFYFIDWFWKKGFTAYSMYFAMYFPQFIYQQNKANEVGMFSEDSLVNIVNFLV